MSINESSFYPILGSRIEELRLKGGITQEGLAKELKLTRAAVSNIERGKQRVYAHHLPVIAEALGVEVGDLLPQQRRSAPSGQDSSLAQELRLKLSGPIAQAIAAALEDRKNK